MNHAIEFIETSVFTRQIKTIATDDDLRQLQEQLIAQPDKGELIVGTGGLRKVRMAVGTRGKRGGARVIYFLSHIDRIYLLFAYVKNTQETLSEEEKARLKFLVSKLKGERHDPFHRT